MVNKAFTIIQVPEIPKSIPKINYDELFDELNTKPSGTNYLIESKRKPQSLYWSIRSVAKTRGLSTKYSFHIKNKKLYVVVR